MSQHHGVEILYRIYFQEFSESLLDQCRHQHGCSVAAKPTDKLYTCVIKQHLCCLFFLACFPAVSLIAPVSFFFFFEESEQLFSTGTDQRKCPLRTYADDTLLQLT